MHYYEVAISKIFRAGSDFLTYSSEDALTVGQIVIVEVGKKQFSGVVFKETVKPEYPTKSIHKVVSIKPLPLQQIELIKWISEYYATPIPSVIQSFLPGGLDKKRKKILSTTDRPKRIRTKILLNNDQVLAIETIDKMATGTTILHGVTGSGKTEVYIELTKRTLESGKSAVILTPEISLTPQLIAEFSHHFNNIIITHSKMTEAKRYKSWVESLESNKPMVAIGPRSALFLPLENIGLIIVDESHESSYKQDQSPKYSALRAATVLGRLHNSKVVFGSATPTVSDIYISEKSNRPIIKMNHSAKINATSSDVTLVDMTKKELFKKHRFISDKLLTQIGNNLENKLQTLIFHNRRGNTQTTICYKCSWVANCQNCQIPLTLHSDSHHMRCHICSHTTNIPTSCPNCNSVDIIHKGIGTKLIEHELSRLFPNANIARFDTDNKNKDSLDSRYQELYDGTIDIAIGTQSIAKGLDLPFLRTVGVVQADSGLALPDFSTDERIFQLLTQVIGRVGRNEHKTNVILQTYQPNHPVVQFGMSQDYDGFYNYCLNERSQKLFPPFVHLLKLTCSYKTEAAVIKNTKIAARELRLSVRSGIQILGPTPAFYEKYGDTHRWQLVIKSKDRQPLVDIAKKFTNHPNWQIDLDPSSLL